MHVVVCILVIIDLIFCCACDAGAGGILALQNGMILTRLLNNSGCINAKYIAGQIQRSKRFPVRGEQCHYEFLAAYISEIVCLPYATHICILLLKEALIC
jgi:hypothetical protein